MAGHFEFEQGYTGADSQFGKGGDAAQAMSGNAQKQHGYTQDLHGANKGAFATQAGNGSTSTANTMNAAATMNAANAAGGRKFVRDAAGHEEHGADTQRGQSNAQETLGTDLMGKINPV